MEDIKQLNEEVKKFYNNIKKDNKDRQLDIQINNNYLIKLSKYVELKNDVIKDISVDDKISVVVNEFEQIHNKISEVIKSRLKDSEKKPETMANFDIKIALSLITKLDDKIESIEELISNVQYYESILLETEKKKLIEFILKQRLNRSQRLKLNNNYENIDLLIKDIEKFLLPTQTPQILNRRIATAYQGNRSIKDYGRYLEKLLENMTIAQSDSEETNKILRNANEPNTVVAFVEGLNDNTVRNAVRARNTTQLRQAIQIAIEQDMLQKGQREREKVYSFKRNYRGSNNRGRYNQGNSRGSHNNSHNNYQNNNNNFNQNKHNKSRGHNNYRGRGRYNNQKPRNDVNCAETEKNSKSGKNNSEEEQIAFFKF